MLTKACVPMSVSWYRKTFCRICYKHTNVPPFMNEVVFLSWQKEQEFCLDLLFFLPCFFWGDMLGAEESVPRLFFLMKDFIFLSRMFLIKPSLQELYFLPVKLFLLFKLWNCLLRRLFDTVEEICLQNLVEFANKNFRRTIQCWLGRTHLQRSWIVSSCLMQCCTRSHGFLVKRSSPGHTFLWHC